MSAVKAAYLAAFDLAPPALPDTPAEIGDGLEDTIEALLPPGAIIPCNLLAATIATDFTGGLGDVGTAYDGWAICDGNNGTPDLSDKFIRHKSTGAGASGGNDSSAHTHSLSNAGGAEIVTIGNNLLCWGVRDGPLFDYVDQGVFTGDTGTGNRNSSPLVGNTDAASATENRPAYYELVYLMRV